MHLIGHVFEIPTRKGLGYFQVTHWDASMGHLVRVLDTVANARPSDLNSLVSRQHRFVVFFPVGHALSRRIVTDLGTFGIPAQAERFPLFRAQGPPPIDPSKPKIWSLWDGGKSRRVGLLTTDQHELPIKEIWNDTLLIHRIDDPSWRWSNDR